MANNATRRRVVNVVLDNRRVGFLDRLASDLRESGKRADRSSLVRGLIDELAYGRIKVASILKG